MRTKNSQLEIFMKKITFFAGRKIALLRQDIITNQISPILLTWTLNQKKLLLTQVFQNFVGKDKGQPTVIHILQHYKEKSLGGPVLPQDVLIHYDSCKKRYLYHFFH